MLAFKYKLLQMSWPNDNNDTTKFKRKSIRNGGCTLKDTFFSLDQP